MIVCPACHAENPDGTKICVKCATELPKTAAGAKAQAAAVASKEFGVNDLRREMFDALWLLLIILLILIGFVAQATHWSWFHFTDREEAKMIKEPVVPVVVHHVPHKHTPGKKVAKAPVVKPVGEKPAVEYGSAETFFKKANKQFDSQKYQSSYNYLKQALEIDPTYAKAYFGLGYLYSRFDMKDVAVRMYEMALRFDPNHAQSINNLAVMYFRAGNYDDALSLLEKAVTLNGTDADFEYNLGSIYFEKNQADAALQAFQKADALRPNDPSIYNNMALTYEMMGKKQEAEDYWQKVLKISNSADLLQQAKNHLTTLQTQG